jgi:hypothetical protein
MNSTSFGERGGSVALVDGGSVRVGWPGAPGCTITGLAGSACCARTDSENKQRVPVTISPHLDATLITDSLPLTAKNFIGRKYPTFFVKADFVAKHLCDQFCTAT